MNIETAVADKIIELLSAQEGWEEDSSSPIKGHFKKPGCPLSIACGKYFVNVGGDHHVRLQFNEKEAQRIRAQFNVLIAHLQEIQKVKAAQESISVMENAFSILCNSTPQ
jgi:hypothetical protein